MTSDLRNPNSLLYKCSKVSNLKQRFQYTRRNHCDWLVKDLCKENGITLKQLEDYEKEYWENIQKVIMGTYEVR